MWANGYYEDYPSPIGSPYLMDLDDYDFCREQRLKSAEVDHCDTENEVYIYYPYSSEGESIPSDAEDESGEIPSMKPRRLFYEDGIAGCSSNVNGASGVEEKDSDDVKAEWVERNIRTYIDRRNGTKASTIRNKITSDHNIKVKYLIARRARIRCLEGIHGSFEESFRYFDGLVFMSVCVCVKFGAKISICCY